MHFISDSAEVTVALQPAVQSYSAELLRAAEVTGQSWGDIQKNIGYGEDGAPQIAFSSLFLWLNSMVYGRYNWS